MSVACLLAASPATAAVGDFAVTDDGSGVAVLAVPAGAGEPFSGLDDVTEDRLRAEGAELGELSRDGLDELLSLPAAAAPAEERSAPESILGSDARTRSYTTTYPAQAVVLITFEGGRCSGFLISNDTVATAGHCVHPGDGSAFYDLASYEIFPGFDGTSAPFGSCNATKLFSVRGWTRLGDETFDYGAIKLGCTIGNVTGWFGLSANQRNNTPAIVTGYPGDKPLEQWQASDKVRATTSRQLFYAADTGPGNSGGPVWQDLFVANASVGPYAYAIHTYGTSGSGLAGRYNHGTRIVTDVLRNYNNWIAAP